MDSDEELRASVKKRNGQVVVSIEEGCQEKAGIASLTWEPVVAGTAQTLEIAAARTEPQEPQRPPETPVPKGSGSEEALPGSLQEELDHKRELLKIAQDYYRELEKMALEQGQSLSVKDRREMRKYERKIGQLKKEVADLGARVRLEKPNVVEDHRPYATEVR